MNKGIRLQKMPARGNTHCSYVPDLCFDAHWKVCLHADLYRKPVTPPNYQEEWSGRWTVGINKLTTWYFRRDGTWTVSPTNPFIISEEGTYSVTDTSFVLTAGVGSSNVVRGTWNTIADKLVLYIESTSSFPFNREALVFDKYIESIEERKQRIGQEGGVMSPPPKLGSQ